MILESYLWIGLAVLSGSFIQSTTGMGFGQIVGPVMGLLEPSLIPVVLLVLMLPLNGHIAWRERSSINWFGFKWITLGRIVGTAVGLTILIILPINFLGILLGVSIVFASVASLVAPVFSPGKAAFSCVGVLTGITETSTGVGGPMLALSFQHMSVATLRSSAAMCFVVGEVLSLLLLTISGYLNPAQIKPLFWLLPLLLLGMFLGERVHKSVNTYFLRRFVIAFAICSGVLLLLKSIMGILS